MAKPAKTKSRRRTARRSRRLIAARVQRNRSALHGRRSTEAVPSVEEFLGLQRDPRAAFAAGHVGELVDVITAARKSADLSANRRAYTVERIVLPNGSIDANVQPDDPIPLPAWAFEIVCRTALHAFEYGDVPKRQKGSWYARYRASLIHWHRFVLVQMAINAGSTQSPNNNKNPTAFDVVSEKLRGTSFAASAKAMENSYRKVRRDLKRREAWRYYRSRSYATYGQLLDPDADIVIRIGGIH